MSTPLLFLCGWFSWGAWASHKVFETTAGSECPLTAEIFQLHLYDRIRQDLRRTVLRPPPDPPALPSYSLELSRSDLQTLTAGLSEGSERPYVPCLVSSGGPIVKARARVRGAGYWHWAYPQKSLRISVDQGSALDGDEVFNLINEVSPISMGEPVVLDVLRGLGVMTPECRLVRVTINKRPMGVYVFMGHVAEALLRKNTRAQGSLYSGDDAPVDSVSGLARLWMDASCWTKVASWKPEEAASKAEIDRLVRMIGESTAVEFAEFARDELDLEKFAAFDAVDAAFGGDQHDWQSNHKLFFDPYKARFEPVGWNFRGWRHEPAVQPVEHPMRLRLAMVPGYLARRDRVLHGLLRGSCAVSEIRKRLLDQVRQAAPEFASDPYWDSYRLLPPLNRELRRLVRPMNEERQALVLESETRTFSERSMFLLRRLEEERISVWLGLRAPGIPGYPLEVVVDGHSAFSIESARVEFGESQPPGPGWRLWRDMNLDGSLNPGADDPVATGGVAGGPAIKAFGPMCAAVRFDARPDRSASTGGLAVSRVPRKYIFFVEAGEGLNAVELQFRNEVTGSRFSRRVEPAGRHADVKACAPCGSPARVPLFEPGETDVHPWLLEEKPGTAVPIGPGEVEFRESRIFRESEPVTIRPGTTLKLHPGVSLVFLGGLKAEGTPDRPVAVEPAQEDKPFAGIAVMGPGSSGSALSNVRVRGGSRPSWNMGRFTGMLNFHDTSGIVLRDCCFSGNTVSDEILHFGYARGVEIENCVFERILSDAVDLEFSEARIASCRFFRPGQEAIDMMDSMARISDCVVHGAGGNGIAVGERSEAWLSGCLVSSSKTGMLVKSRSVAVISGSVFYKCGLAVNQKSKSPKYGGRCETRGDVLHAVECAAVFESDDGSAPEVLRQMTHFPADGSIDHLMRDVLGLEEWPALGDFMDGLEKGGKGIGGGND